jgi:hypothetical protein
MEAKDAWILLAGALLGFLTSLLATFTAPSIGGTFDKLKSGFIERNKASALASYTLVRDLKSGKRDKYLYAINHWGMISFLTLGSIFSGAAGLVTGRLLHQAEHTFPTGAPLFLLAFPIVVLALVFRSTMRLLLTLDRVENFQRYRAKLLQRWPDLVLPE